MGPAGGPALVAYELVDERRGSTLPRLDGAETAVSKEAPDEVCFTVRGRLAFEDGSTPVDVEQSIRVFDCGVLFCDLHLWVRPGESLLITRASVALRLAGVLASLGKYRWGYDRPVPDPGVEVERPVLYLPADRTVDEAGTFHPYLDVAWSVREHAAFTNRAGFVLEEGRPFGTDHPAAFAHSFGRREGDSLAYRWHLYRGKPLQVTAPYAYANRWGLSLAGPRNNERGRREAKNSLIGARVYTWQNDGVGHGRMGEKAWYPRDRDIDAMAAKGANVVLLHTGWMDAGGEGAGWEGNYVVADRTELRRVVARAHRAGMRVGLYIRGLEYYALDRDTRWFTDFLTPDFDGVYVDWSSFLYQPHRYLPASVPVYGEKLQHRQNSTRRAHAFTHFLYTRKLRQLVGRDGFLIGHPGCQHKEYSGFALGYFDAMLTGESAGTTFLNSPEQHVYYGAHSACGALAWTNTHPVTRGPKATAYEAAFGTGPQIVLGSRYPLDPDDERNQFMMPLWQLLSSADLARRNPLRPAGVREEDPGFPAGTALRALPPGRRQPAAHRRQPGRASARRRAPHRRRGAGHHGSRTGDRAAPGPRRGRHDGSGSGRVQHWYDFRSGNAAAGGPGLPRGVGERGRQLQGRRERCGRSEGRLTSWSFIAGCRWSPTWRSSRFHDPGPQVESSAATLSSGMRTRSRGDRLLFVARISADRYAQIHA